MPRDLSKSLQRTLTHLLPPPIKGGKFASPIPTHFRSSNKFVQVKDRIPFWNIAPGDKIKVIRGNKDVRNKSGVVDLVDRETNRVYLKEPEFKVKKRAPAEYPTQVFDPSYTNTDTIIYAPRAFHVSNVRLQLQVSGKIYTASRIISGSKSWDRRYRRFTWKRAGVFRELISQDNPRGLYNIPWVKEDVPKVDQSARAGIEWDGKLKTPWKPSITSLLSTLTISPSSSSSPFSSSTPPSTPLPAFPTSLYPTSLFPKRIIKGNLNEEIGELNVNNLDLRKGYYSRSNRTKRFNLKKDEEKRFGRGERMESIKMRRKKEEEVEIL